MKKHVSYKILAAVSVMALALVLASCSPSTEKSMEVTDLMEKTQATEESPTEEATEEPEAAMDEPEDNMTEDTTADEDGDKVFTLEELKQYDGTNGNPAYVAVDGVVYDVSDKALWSGGTHKGNTAGQDLSEAILKSPHGKAKLEELPVVGTLAEE
jgi:predicted heme/steroid binding protein